MKIATILGTRPEIIRLSLVIATLDKVGEHVLVHTGQNFDDGLSRIFFEQMGIRQPDVYFNAESSTLARQVSRILVATEEFIQEERPDRILILGDTNSALSAFVAKRMGVPVYHMEAGNRCYDDRVPEEVNRRVIDHSSDILMPYTERSRVNLLREGIEGTRVFVTGNPINEVLEHYSQQIGASQIFEKLQIAPRQYILATLHRSENVDVRDRLATLVTNLANAAKQLRIPVICSLHPRTADKLSSYGVAYEKELVRMISPVGFFDFVALEREARCVLTDSGTVQEECCILHVPNVTLRDTTERPETVECGSNILSGDDPEVLRTAIELALAGNRWTVPPEYLVPAVSRTVAKIVTGYNHRLRGC
jgi:UDP-N-acetylglucosamine 2-epimerase (non-hydrolysing)